MSLIGDLFTLGLMKVFASKEEKKKFRDSVALSNAMLDAGIDCIQKDFMELVPETWPDFSERLERDKIRGG